MNQFKQEDVEKLLTATFDLEDLILENNNRQISIPRETEFVGDIQKYAKINVEEPGLLLVDTKILLGQGDSNYSATWSTIYEELRNIYSVNKKSQTHILRNAKERIKINNNLDIPRYSKITLKERINSDANILLDNFIELALAINADNVKSASASIDKIKQSTKTNSQVEIYPLITHFDDLSLIASQIVIETKNKKIEQKYLDIAAKSSQKTIQDTLSQIKPSPLVADYAGPISSELIARNLIKKKSDLQRAPNNVRGVLADLVKFPGIYALIKCGAGYASILDYVSNPTNELNLVVGSYLLGSAATEFGRWFNSEVSPTPQLTRADIRFLPIEIAGIYRGAKLLYNKVKE